MKSFNEWINKDSNEIDNKLHELMQIFLNVAERVAWHGLTNKNAPKSLTEPDINKDIKNFQKVYENVLMLLNNKSSGSHSTLTELQREAIAMAAKELQGLSPQADRYVSILQDML